MRNAVIPVDKMLSVDVLRSFNTGCPEMNTKGMALLMPDFLALVCQCSERSFTKVAICCPQIVRGFEVQKEDFCNYLKFIENWRPREDLNL